MSEFKKLDSAVTYANEIIENNEIISGVNLEAYREFLKVLTEKVYELAKIHGEKTATEIFFKKIVDELGKNNEKIKNVVLKYINTTDYNDLKIQLAKVRTINSELKYKYSNVDFSNDLEQCLQNKVELIELTEPKPEINSSYSKEIIEKLTTTEFKKGKTFIPINLKDYFINLLEKKYVPSSPKWINSDWMLYVLLKSFIENEIFDIEEKSIPNFMLGHFTFEAKTTKKSIKDNYSRAIKGYVLKIFTTKLDSIYYNYKLNSRKSI